MRSAYATTTVRVERSQQEIRRLLMDNGAERLAFAEERESGRRWVSVTFAIGAHVVRVRVPLQPVDEDLVESRHRRARTRTREQIRDELYEQEERRVWRVLAWNLKARMVAVQEGLETFEEAFLAHILDPRTNATIFEQLVEHGRVELGTPLLALPAG